MLLMQNVGMAVCNNREVRNRSGIEKETVSGGCEDDVVNK